MNRMARMALAVVGLAALLAVAGWLDGTVMLHAQQAQAQARNPIATATGFTWTSSFGYMVTAACVLGVGLLGWWSRSWVTGTAFVVGGAFFALLDVIAFQWAAEINDAPPVLPEPIALAVSHLYFWQSGPLASMRIVGAAALLVGLVVIGAEIRGRFAASTARRIEVPDGEPVRP